MDNIHIEDENGLVDSNIDLVVPISEKANPSDEDCSVIVIKNELQMERVMSSDSDESYMKLKENEHDVYMKLKDNEQEPYMKQNEHETFMKQNENEQYTKQNEHEPYTKQTEHESFMKQNEHEPYMKQNEHDTYMKQNEHETYMKQNEHETYMKIKEQHEHDEAPVMQRKLFGPPCWNPEQLVAAMDSVKNGTSVSAAARKFGIPRTTLSNKIYGRRRKLYNASDGTASPYSNHMGMKVSVNHDNSLVYVIGAENEKMVANIVAKQKLVDVDAFSMTRAIFDIVKYLASDKGHVLKDDEEVKEWIQYFFLRYPAAYFPITLFELRMAHADDEYFADFVFDSSKNEPAEEVLKKLMSLITRRLLVEKKVLMSIHLFWWYTFLTTFTDVRDYFLDNLTWPDTILNHTSLQMVDDKGVHQILISTLLRRTHNGITMASSDLRRVKSITSESSDSPTQVTARRSEVSFSHMYDNVPRPSSINSYVIEDSTSQDSNNISSTSTSTNTLSLGKLLAQEALSAVERKLSTEELRYFTFRYDNPRLDDAYQVWKNLKSASEKEEEENIVDNNF